MKEDGMEMEKKGQKTSPWKWIIWQKISPWRNFDDGSGKALKC